MGAPPTYLSNGELSQICIKLGECRTLWGEHEQVAGCISVSKKMPGEEVRASNVHAGVWYVLILGSLYTMCWVSLIAGVKYRVQ